MYQIVGRNFDCKYVGEVYSYVDDPYEEYERAKKMCDWLNKLADYECYFVREVG